MNILCHDQFCAMFRKNARTGTVEVYTIEGVHVSRILVPRGLTYISRT